MPFIALCPHCRLAKVQAPSRKRGTLHTCPKCAADFPLEPLDESNLAVDYKLPPVEFDIAEAYKEKEPVDDFASARTVVHRPLDAPTNFTPSEVMPFATESAPLPVLPPTAKTTTVQQIDYTPDPTRPDPPFLMALGAGGLFGLAMLLTQVPYGRFIAIPLLLAGLLMGLMALPGLDARKNLGRGAIFVNAIGLLLVLFLPSWLGVDSWMPQGDPNAAPKPALSVPRNGSAPSPAGWVDIANALWQQDDVRVDITSVKLEPLDPKVKAGPQAKKVLRVTLKVSNVGVARAVPVNGWTPETAPRLTVATGPVVPFQKVETPLPMNIMPGKDAEIVLVFDVLPPQKDALMLELQPVGFSVIEPVKFTIPAAMIAK